LTEKLPDTLTLGPVQLTITDMERSLVFYQEQLGFQVHHREGSMASLGAGGDNLLVLHEDPNARRVVGTSGLYHYAILVPSRRHLALSLKHIADTETRVQGFANHLVSEAIYLPDPDGNGIEIYRDLPRDQWEYEPNGQPRMGTLPLDLRAVLSELDDSGDIEWRGLHPDTKMGHVHLHVAHLDETEHFYGDILGFDLMLRFVGTASFFSVGGYHHHLGTNIWAGEGAPPPPQDAVGLRWYTLNLPDDESLNSVTSRLDAANIPIEATDAGLQIRDPAMNGVLLRT
jgi:catechol 2,3-dioxygenase